jgi:metal-responsive CopG/Arc/MetJ family transcriptional regulator
MDRLVHIKLNDALIKKIDEVGKRNKVIEEALKQYFQPKAKEQKVKVDELVKENTHLQETIKLLENNNRQLESQLGFLQQQYSLLTQRMLEPPEKIKHRWKFWRR